MRGGESERARECKRARAAGHLRAPVGAQDIAATGCAQWEFGRLFRHRKPAFIDDKKVKCLENLLVCEGIRGIARTAASPPYHSMHPSQQAGSGECDEWDSSPLTMCVMKA